MSGFILFKSRFTKLFQASIKQYNVINDCEKQNPERKSISLKVLKKVRIEL